MKYFKYATAVSISQVIFINKTVQDVLTSRCTHVNIIHLFIFHYSVSSHSSLLQTNTQTDNKKHDNKTKKKSVLAQYLTLLESIPLRCLCDKRGGGGGFYTRGRWHGIRKMQKDTCSPRWANLVQGTRYGLELKPILLFLFARHPRPANASALRWVQTTPKQVTIGQWYVNSKQANLKKILKYGTEEEKKCGSKRTRELEARNLMRLS